MTQPQSSPKLLDQVRQTMRLRHMSLSSERNYVHYITQYIHFHKDRTGQFMHPRDLGTQDVRNFLSHLAIEKHVAASTQNIALCALIFLYKQVLRMPLGIIENIEWAKTPEHLPAVWTSRRHTQKRGETPRPRPSNIQTNKPSVN